MLSDMRASAADSAAGLIVAALALVALASSRDPSRAGYAAHAVAHVVRAPARQPSAAGVHALREGESLDLNTATPGDLLLLPGVGPKLADRIVAERERRKGFARVEELSQVKGIGPATFARIARFVHVTDRSTAQR